jgi:hypothetical protein
METFRFEVAVRSGCFVYSLFLFVDGFARTLAELHNWLLPMMQTSEVFKTSEVETPLARYFASWNKRRATMMYQTMLAIPPIMAKIMAASNRTVTKSDRISKISRKENAVIPA